MTGPIEITAGNAAPDADYKPTILPGFGPFSHIEQYSTGRPGEFSHYGIMPNGQAVPLENFDGGPAAVGSPGQAAPASPAAAPVPEAPSAAMLSPPPPAAAPSMLPAMPAGPGQGLPSAPPAAPPMATLRIAEPDTPAEPAELPEPPPQARPGPGSAMAAESPSDAEAAQQRIRIKQKQLQLQQSSTVPLDKAIDRETGAPVAVRGAVGIASTPEDRLATLRKFYPDAQPFEKDNFVFRHPATGRPTLYNEENPRVLGIPIPTMGDLASIGPEIAEGVGGVIGGGLAAASTPFTMGAGAAAVPLGVGAGALTGRKAWEGIVGPLSGTVDTRGAGAKMLGDAGTFGLNAAAGPATSALLGGVKRALGPVVRNGVSTAGRLGDFVAANVRPVIGAVTGNRTTQTLENVLHGAPGATERIGANFEGATNDLRDAAQALTQRYATGGGANPAGVGGTAETIGHTITQAARQAGERFSNRIRDELRPAVDMAIGPDTRVGLPNLRMLRRTLQNRVNAAPNTEGPDLNPAIAHIDRLLADEMPQVGRPAGLPFRNLRNARTALGRNLRRPDVSGYTDAQARAMRHVYDAMRQDIFHAAGEADRRLVAAGQQPVAVRALRTQDRYVRFNRNANLPTLQTIENASTNADKVRQLVDGWSKQGGEQLARLRRQMRPEQWDEVASLFLSRLGQKTGADTGFSVAAFLRNLSPKSLPAAARMQIFGGTRYAALAEDLARLERIASYLHESQKLANTSRTAHNLAYLAAGGSLVEALFHGDLTTAAATMAGVGAANAAARLLTYPPFVHWLVTASQARTPAAVSMHLLRLAAIAEAEPGMRQYIHQYMGSVKATGNQGGSR